MDIDVDTLDLDDDPVKTFINIKLKEIRSHNNELSNQLQKKNKLLSDYINQTVSDKGTTYSFDENWKKAIGNHIIVGYSSKHTFEFVGDVKLILQWDDEKPIDYSVKTFTYQIASTPEPSLVSKEIKSVINLLETTKNTQVTNLSSEWIDSSTNFSDITAVITIPDFSAKQHYNFECIMMLQTNDNDIQIPLPAFQITVKDVYNLDTLISEHDILEYKKEAILSFLSLNPKLEFILCIEEMSTNKDLIDVLHGCMRQVRHTSNLYMARNISKLSCGPLIKIHEVIEEGIYLIHIFYGIERDVEILIHFMFQNIPFLTIIPKKIGCDLFKQFDDDIKLLLSKTVNKTILQKLGKCIESEVELLESVLVENIREKESEYKTQDTIDFSVNKETYFKLRKQLITLENNSSFIYGIINSIINSSVNKK